MKKMSRLLFFFGVLFVFTVGIFILPQNASADKAQGTGGKYYCILCEHRDTNDPLYEKEQQFYRKVSLIKQEYGNSIDEIVLASSVLHRYGRTDAYNALYTKDFNEAEYSKNVGLIKRAFANVSLSSDEEALVQANERYDLLTLAAIVMNDSSNGGQYSDACFKEGLAGNKLVSNDSNGFFANIFNTIVCAETKLKGSDAATGDSSNVQSISEKVRISNINKVCENGYVGGLYDGIKDLKNEDEKQAMKEHYAQQIIDFANFYKDLYSYDDGNSCASNISGTNGDFASWKQYDSQWGDISLGGYSPLRRIGCTITSTAMQIARSGTKIDKLPSGFSDFNPGAFATTLNANGGFVDGGNFTWSGFEPIAPNWRVAGGFITINEGNNARLAKIISDELSTPYDGKYQKFIILCIYHAESSQHWVAVNGVENGVVTIFDPAADGTTLDENYNNWVVEGYKVMYATDVMAGQTASNTDNNKCENGEGSIDGLISFLAYVEGVPTCNYRGQGEGTGYLASYLEDGMGYTAAFGLTYYMEPHAKTVGYNDFIADKDGPDHCNNKMYIDKMVPEAIAAFRAEVEDYAAAKNVTLTGVQSDALTSIAYGGGQFEEYIIDALVNNSADSDAVFSAWKKTYNPELQYRYGLGLRRMAEYEVFSTGNYNAEKPFNLFDNDSEIQAASKSTVTSNWPTKRDVLLYDGDTSGAGSNSLARDKNAKCVKGKAVSGKDTASYNCALDGVVQCAKDQLGKDYVLGAEGPDTFDCSGLVTYCYNKALGVDISHYSHDQHTDSNFVDVSSEAELVPGDILTLVYPGSDTGHVAIYIGDGKMIHAEAPGSTVREGTVEDFFSLDSSAKFRHYKNNTGCS